MSADAKPLAIKEIPLSEVAKHCTESDCWVAIHGNVYDITKFLHDHPGGPETIVEVAGRECTEQFEDTGHSKSARDMMKKYLIGKLPEGDAAGAGSHAAGSAAAKPASAVSSQSNHGGSYWAYAIPVLILLGALYFQFFGKAPASHAS